jgi:hypothetical protein
VEVLRFAMNMEDDITQMWRNLSLADEENVEWEAPVEECTDVASQGLMCVVGKLFVDHIVSKETIKKELLTWWKLLGTISFKILGENLFLIEFTSEEDKGRVLEGRPWVFEGSLFLIEDFDGCTSPAELSFDKAAFWIRMKNLPLACMGRETGRMLGSSVGTMVDIDTDAKGVGWGEALRVKVLIDLRKPLARGRKLNMQGITKWIPFQYERLPRFCFNCGLIVHGKTGCPKKSMLRQQDNQEFGNWLRAPSPPRRYERGPSKYVSRRERGFYGQNPREEPSTKTAAAGGSQAAMEDEGDEVFSQNPKCPRANKERIEYGGGNHGGVAANYLAKVQSETESFQFFSKKGGLETGDISSKKKEQYKERELIPGSVTKKARRSPSQSGIRGIQGENFNAEGGFMWSKKGEEGEVFKSPNLRKEGKLFRGPMLADVEKNLKNTKESGVEKIQRSKEAMMTPVGKGLGKRKEIDGGEVYGDNNNLNGLGLAEAAEQPRRPQ